MSYEQWDTPISKGLEAKLWKFTLEFEFLGRPWLQNPCLSLEFGGNYVIYKCFSFKGAYITFTFWELGAPHKGA